MKRIQLFEFEDFSWFPGIIRASMTNLIVILHKLMGTRDVLSKLLLNIRQHYDYTRIVDLGSGSGGVMPEVIKKINETFSGPPVKLLLTDLYPNEQFIHQINKNKSAHITYHSIAIDATDFGYAPAGLKTMINSFHHMPPEVAKNILSSAQNNKEPLLIYEMAENKIPTILWWLLLPISLLILILMVFFMTPFVRPLTWQQLLFTYLIPIIPICYAWDGQASMVRMYTFDDIKELLKDTESEDYTWEMAQAKKKNGKKLGYYILGMPKSQEI
jgi:hypothetical protein